jgi:hypothetical protein
VPLIVVDLTAGRSAEQIGALPDGVHDAVVEVLGVLVRDRYQIVHEHDTSRMVVQDTGLDIELSRDVVVIQVASRPRPRERRWLRTDWSVSSRRADVASARGT